MLKTIFNLCAD